MPDGQFSLSTHRHMELIDITDQLQEAVRASEVDRGILYVLSPHTTGAITINEGADPDVRRDLIGALQEMLPKNFPYRHREGNSPAHLLTSLIGASCTVILGGGRLQLGTWQRVYFCEFDGPRSRRVWWKILED
jgi:secondary thiamine-phosphate synthase enzyme